MTLPEHLQYTVQLEDEPTGVYRLTPVEGLDLEAGIYLSVGHGMARAFIVLDEPMGMDEVVVAVKDKRRRKLRLRERFDL